MKRPTDHRPVPTVALALMAAFLLGSGFFALIAIVIPGAAMMLLTGFLLLGFFVAQYFVWGRWLYRYVMAQEQKRIAAEAARDSASPSDQFP